MLNFLLLLFSEQHFSLVSLYPLAMAAYPQINVEFRQILGNFRVSFSWARFLLAQLFWPNTKISGARFSSALLFGQFSTTSEGQIFVCPTICNFAISGLFVL